MESVEAQAVTEIGILLSCFLFAVLSRAPSNCKMKFSVDRSVVKFEFIN